MNVDEALIGDFIDAVVLDPSRAAEMLRRNPDLRDGRWHLRETVLHFLAIEGKAEDVRLLGEWGFDPNAVNEFGDTPLIDAAKLGRDDVARVLLDLGADPNARSDTHDNVLFCAVHSGNPRLVDLLLSKGADPNARSDTADSILFSAVRSGEPKVVDLLLNWGADPRFVTLCEETVFDALPEEDDAKRLAIEGIFCRHGVRRRPPLVDSPRTCYIFKYFKMSSYVPP